MSARPLPPGRVRPASPEPGSRDEQVGCRGRESCEIHCCLDDHDPLPAAAAAQATTGGEADECPHNEDRASCAAGCAAPTPSVTPPATGGEAGKRTTDGGMRDYFDASTARLLAELDGPAYGDLACHRGRHEDGGWYCVARGQSWPCSPAPSVTPDSDQLRDEIAREIAAESEALDSPLSDDDWECYVDEAKRREYLGLADALLSGPVGQLLREHTERGEKLERVRALRKAWEDDPRHWYYENRHTHEQGINYASGYEDGWNHADELLGQALGDQP